MNSFCLLIEGLEFEAIIGILESERLQPQKIILDGKFFYHYQDKDFIDYVKVKNLIQKLLQTNQYMLIEEALIDIIKNLKNSFANINKVELSLKKPNILDDCIVGVKFKKVF